MKNVFDMSREEFITELAKRTAPEFIYHNAPVIYDLLAEVMEQDCSDSLLREWAFQWTSEALGIDYNDIYERWQA